MKEPKQAKEFFLKKLEITDKLYHGDHLDKVTTYNLIAGACDDLEEYVCASEYFEKAYNMRSKLGIADDRQQVSTHSSSGSVFYKLG